LTRQIHSVRSSTPFITFVIAYAVFTDQFLFAAIIPVVPFSLEERLHISKDQVQFWVAVLFGVFGLAAFASSPIWGWWSDRHASRRLPFLIGLLVLFGATLILWFGENIGLQVLGRILQGTASTVVWTTGLAVLVDTVGQKHIGEYMGWIGIALNSGSILAPLLGGIVFSKAGYNAVFGLVVGVVILDILLRLVMVEKSSVLAEFEHELATASLRRGSAPIDGSSIHSDDEEKKGPIVSITVSKTSSTLPAVVRLACSYRVIVTLWATVILASIFSGFQAVLPLKVHDTFGWDATGGGLIFLPLSAPALLGPVIGRFTDRYGGRWFAFTGFVILCVALALLRIIEHDTAEHKALLCILLILVGSCMTLTLEPVLAEITSAAARLEQSDIEAGLEVKSSYCQAYALFYMAWAAGNFAGPLWGGLLVEAAGWKTMTMSMSIVAGVSAIPIGLFLGGWLLSRKKPDV
ncbi:putative MFS-type transporter C18.02, partial [Pseudocercospora fuligena]